MDNYLVIFIGILVHSCIFSVKSKDLFCNDQLIRSLPDDHLTASSNRGDPIVQTFPHRGRLNTTDYLLKNGTTLMGGWSPSSDSKGHYIQATFDQMTMINEILTQGRHQGNGRITMYTVNYTEDGTTWHTINNDVGVEQIFQGNADSDTIQTNALDCPIFAKGIRIIPVAWETHVALRFDVSGCYVDTGLSVSSAAPIMTTANSTAAVTTSPTPYGSTTTHAIMTITPSSTTTTQTTKASLTTPTTIKTTISTTRKPLVTTTTTNKTTTTQKSTPKIKTTTPYVFFPGIINPFGTTRKTTLLTTPIPPTTTKPFRPGIPDPFGPGQLIG